MNMKMKMRMLSLLLCFVMLVGMLPTTAFAASACPHTNVDWHKSSSGDEEHFKICTNPDCDDRSGSIVERGFHTDTNADGNCDDCSVELINVTFDYEDPAKTDKVVLFAKGAVARDYNAYIADWDEKDGYVADKWELSLEKTPATSLSKDGIGQTIMVGDAVYTTHWHKVYEEIHFNFSGYEIGANISDGVLTDDIDGYAPLHFPDLWGGKDFVIVADKDGIPDMTDPSTMLKVVTGAFEENKDYWLAVLIGGEGRNITGDIEVEAYGIDDYFLDSPDCVGKYRVAEGEAEIAFFKLKPLQTPEAAYTVTFDTKGGSEVAPQTIEEGGKVTKPVDPTKDGFDFVGWTFEDKDWNFENTVTGDMTLVAVWKEKEVTPPGDDNDDDTTKPEDKPSDSPQTGDNSMIWLWITLLFVSGAGVVAITVFRKKRFSVK